MAHANHPVGAPPRIPQTDCLVWTAAQAKDALSTLLRNTYVMFGGSYKQVKGIPIGTNPAVFIASLSLYVYKFEFVRRVAQAAHYLPPGADVSSQWHRAVRACLFQRSRAAHGVAPLRGTAHPAIAPVQPALVDDISSIGNPYMCWMPYDDQDYSGFRGV